MNKQIYIEGIDMKQTKYRNNIYSQRKQKETKTNKLIRYVQYGTSKFKKRI